MSSLMFLKNDFALKPAWVMVKITNFYLLIYYSYLYDCCCCCYYNCCCYTFFFALETADWQLSDMQSSGRLDLGKHKITWCSSYMEVVEAFGQALPLFVLFVFTQLGNVAGPSSTAVVLSMTALQPENHYNQTISSQCMQVSAVCLKESWSTCGGLIEIGIQVTEIGSLWLFIQVNLCFSQAPRNQMPALYDHFLKE